MHASESCLLISSRPCLMIFSLGRWRPHAAEPSVSSLPRHTREHWAVNWETQVSCFIVVVLALRMDALTSPWQLVLFLVECIDNTQYPYSLQNMLWEVIPETYSSSWKCPDFWYKLKTVFSSALWLNPFFISLPEIKIMMFACPSFSGYCFRTRKKFGRKLRQSTPTTTFQRRKCPTRFVTFYFLYHSIIHKCFCSL